MICPMCKSQISDNCRSCPRCGYEVNNAIAIDPAKQKKPINLWLIIVPAVIVAILIFSAIVTIAITATMTLRPYLDFDKARIEGHSGYATLNTDDVFNYDKFIDKYDIGEADVEALHNAVKFSSTKQIDISNGEKIKYKVDFDYNVISSLSHKSFISFDFGAHTVTASDLEDGIKVDPFDIVTSVSDVEGNLYIGFKTDYKKSNGKFIISYANTTSEGLEISQSDGTIIDTVTFTAERTSDATATVSLSYNKEQLDKAGFFVPNESKEIDIISSSIVNQSSAENAGNIVKLRDICNKNVTDSSLAYENSQYFAFNESKIVKNKYIFIYSKNGGKQYTYATFDNVWINDNGEIVNLSNLTPTFSSSYFNSIDEITLLFTRDNYLVKGYKVTEK